MAEERVFSVLVENIDGDQVVLELDSAVTIRFPATHLPEVDVRRDGNDL